eukprot:4847650-Pleurochrysis_carterae.AAC.1
MRFHDDGRALVLGEHLAQMLHLCLADVAHVVQMEAKYNVVQHAGDLGVVLELRLKTDSMMDVF